MALIATLAILSILAAPPKATLGGSAYQLKVKLQMNGRTYSLPEVPGFDIYRHGVRSLKDEIEFKGKVYKAGKGYLVNSDGKQIQKLEVGRFESGGGGVAFKDALYWLCTVWTDSELGTSFPIVSSHLYTIREVGGGVKVVKDTDLMPMIVEGQAAVDVTRYDNYLRFGGYTGYCALLNMQTGQIMKMPLPASGERLARLSNDAAISTSGRVFWQDGSFLKQLDWPTESWKPIRTIGLGTRNKWADSRKLHRPHDWLGGLQIGDDDLLIATDIVAFAKKKVESAVPQDAVDVESPVRLFYLPKVGIGLVWGFEEFHVKASGKRGVFYSLPSLKPLCRIEWPY